MHLHGQFILTPIRTSKRLSWIPWTNTAHHWKLATPPIPCRPCGRIGGGSRPGEGSGLHWLKVSRRWVCAITDEQLDAIRSHLDDIDHEAATAYERKFRHDVMAHVHTLADAAPAAGPIIHLGATSQFCNCNTELLQLRDALQMISNKVAAVIVALGDFADRWKSLPVLGYTHTSRLNPLRWANERPCGPRTS